MDNWEKRTDVPQVGFYFLQQPAQRFFKDAKPDQLVSIYVKVEYVGQPPNVYGGGAYRIIDCFGYPELIGRVFNLNYSKIII